MIRGKHNIKIGGEFRANQMNVETNAFQDGFWVFTNGWSAQTDGTGGNNIVDFLLGRPSLALHDQTFEGATTGRRWKLFRPYIQDDWRVSPDLTLNLGLAWALVTPITEAHDRQANFNFATGEFLVPGLNSDGRVGIEMDKTAFEPRIGLAWRHLEAPRPQCVQDMPSSTIPHGIRVRKDCGKTRRSLRSRASLASARAVVPQPHRLEILPPVRVALEVGLLSLSQMDFL